MLVRQPSALQRSVLSREGGSDASDICKEAYSMLRSAPAGAAKKQILASLMKVRDNRAAAT